nr:hypothetical protein [Halorubrum sp. ASP1]
MGDTDGLRIILSDVEYSDLHIIALAERIVVVVDENVDIVEIGDCLAAVVLGSTVCDNGFVGLANGKSASSVLCFCLLVGDFVFIRFVLARGRRHHESTPTNAGSYIPTDGVGGDRARLRQARWTDRSQRERSAPSRDEEQWVTRQKDDAKIAEAKARWVVTRPERGGGWEEVPKGG